MVMFVVMVMFMFVWKSNQVYCHKAIKNGHRNYPASWIDVDSIALQESLPLSRVGYLETEQKNHKQGNNFDNFFILRIIYNSAESLND